MPTTRKQSAMNRLERNTYIHPRNALYVSYVDKTVGLVLKYGFTHSDEPYLHLQGAAGIQKRKQGFVVVTKNVDGKKKFKTVQSSDDAMQVQALTSIKR